MAWWVDSKAPGCVEIGMNRMFSTDSSLFNG
jgi:hypothetical protein